MRSSGAILATVLLGLDGHHDEVLGGLTTYRPLVTLAWHTDDVGFVPSPWPGAWHDFQQISVKPHG